MVRYKSVLVLVLFLLLSSMLHSHSSTPHLYVPITLSILAIIFVYACATCTNDLADWEIDSINLQGHKDRPLVTGEGSRRDLIMLSVLTAAAALGLAACVNFITLVTIIVGIILNACYSLPPLRISYHALVTPFYLTLCYVAVPYIVGYGIVSSEKMVAFNWLYMASFYFLFLARICLKDFRDRKGDLLAGKPTLILRYGKKTVCYISTGAALIGGFTLILLSAQELILQWLLGLFILALLIVEYKLYIAKAESLELLSIGYGARMGNGILFALLGTFLLHAQNAEPADLVVFYGSMVIIYGWLFWEYLRRPETFYFGKKRIAS
jgi:4-hydroxybenzoate polyprenyltransferase